MRSCNCPDEMGTGAFGGQADIHFDVLLWRYGIMKETEYLEAVKRALCSKGNNHSLKRIFEDTKKDLTVAFSGGSISRGSDG